MTLDTLLMLLCMEGITLQMIRKGREVIGDPQSFQAWRAALEILLPHPLERGELEQTTRNMKKVKREMSRGGVCALLPEDERFPKALLRLEEPPLVLFALGNLDALTLPLIAAVGTREPSEQGLAQAGRVGRALGRSGAAVVSGLAVGCDAGIHQGCLEVGGIPIAVLPSGVLRCYPPANRCLYHRIMQENGLVISEYLPTAWVGPHVFCQRDRLISGLGRAVVMVEPRPDKVLRRAVTQALEQQQPVGACLGAHGAMRDLGEDEALNRFIAEALGA